MFCTAFSISPLLPDEKFNPKDTIPGIFSYYDRSLEKYPDNPRNLSGRSQAKIVDFQGRHEVYNWGDNGHCVRFTPDKIGDYITFQIHIVKADPDCQYEVESITARFHNEGIYQFEVDGKAVGEPFDGSDQAKRIHGTFPVAPGDYKITYRYIGKGKESGGKILNIVRLEFDGQYGR